MTAEILKMIEWRPISDYEGFYEVSSCGQVRSLKRQIIRSNGRLQTIEAKCLALCVNSSGYYSVNLHNGLGVSGRQPALVHRLVAKAFIQNPEKKPHINHIDGVRTNNNLENLEWCTPSENVIHALRTGLSNPQKGSERPLAKLSETDIPLIRSLLSSGVHQKTIAKMYSVQRTLISGIKMGRRWKHVVLFLLAFSFYSCGSSYHLKKSERHLKKAIALGAAVNSDTVYINKNILVPEIRVDTLIQNVSFTDTLFLTKDRFHVRVKVDTLTKSVYIEGKCESDTVRVEVPISVTKEIKTGWPFWWLVVALVAGFLLSLLRKSN